MSSSAARHKLDVVWPGQILARHLTGLVIGALLGGCASQVVSLSNDGFTITNIHVAAAGGNQPEHAYTAGVCKGFLLSEQQVRDFFVHANYVEDTAPENRYDILPCYSSGTATINSAPYEWVIRAGGIGEFTSEHYRFVKICGKNCCSKVQGIC
jgi:hypothetical protein